MKKVFIGGSRGVSKLNDIITERIDNITNQNFKILIGDANGADKAIQRYLSISNYHTVEIYCSGTICRNNIGNWKTNYIAVPSTLKGRDFYTVKDIKMSEQCDHAFMLWDGKSSGTVNNIINMIINKKSVLIYFSPNKEAYTIKYLSDFENILSMCSEINLQKIDKKIKLDNRIELMKQPWGVK